MINLHDTSGLPIIFESEDNSIQQTSEIFFENKEVVKLDSIRPTLLNKTLKYPTHVYTEYNNICIPSHKTIFSKNKLHYNIEIVPAGLLGVEYTKTHIFSPDNDKNEITAIVDVIYGNGNILVQRMKAKGEFEFDTEVTTASISTIKAGERIVIPQNYMYTFINSSGRPFIIGRLYEDDGKIDYRSIWREQGMAYYIIRKNARKEVVRNPRYKYIPPLENLKEQKLVEKLKLTSVKPIYTQFVNNPERFKKLLV